MNEGQENQAGGRGEADESAAGTNVQDKKLSSEQDVNDHRGDIDGVQEVGTDNKGEVNQKEW